MLHAPPVARASTPRSRTSPSDQAQPGDLVFFYNPIHHVGIYIGGGLMIDAPHTGATVRLVAVELGLRRRRRPTGLTITDG